MLRASDVFVLLYVVDVLLSLSFVLSCSLWSRTDGIVSPPAPLSAPSESQAAPCVFAFFLAYARVCVCDALARAPFSLSSLLPLSMSSRARGGATCGQRRHQKKSKQRPRVKSPVMCWHAKSTGFSSPNPTPRGRGGVGGLFACARVYVCTRVGARVRLGLGRARSGRHTSRGSEKRMNDIPLPSSPSPPPTQR